MLTPGEAAPVDSGTRWRDVVEVALQRREAEAKKKPLAGPSCHISWMKRFECRRITTNTGSYSWTVFVTEDELGFNVVRGSENFDTLAKCEVERDRLYVKEAKKP